jgi:hypothetical protein
MTTDGALEVNEWGEAWKAAELMELRSHIQKTAMLYIAGTEPLIHYLAALANGATDAGAREFAGQFYAIRVKQISECGLFNDDEISRIFPEFDPQRSKGGILIVMGNVGVDDAVCIIARGAAQGAAAEVLQ